jgi:hypothetical protein
VAATLAVEADAAVAAPMAYRTPETATLDALVTVKPTLDKTRTDADIELDAATVKDAFLATLAATATLLEAETENAPKVVRFASTTKELVAENVTAPRLTP